MSIPERLYNISKGYIGQIRDRIDDELTDREKAMAELTDDEGNTSLPVGSDADSLMQRAEAKVTAMRQNLAAQKEIAPVASGNSNNSVVSLSSDQEALLNAASRETRAEAEAKYLDDYVVLGVPVGSELGVIESKYEDLIRRCNPDRFAVGSEDRKKAQEILDRVNAAHDSLRKKLDPTQNRFDKLEF